MNKAQRRAVEFRRKLGLRGQVDAEGVANILGLEVIPWVMQAQEEMRIDRYMCIAEDLEPDERRWMIAHSIGHWFLHPGNHLWIYKHTSFGGRIEREANDFACAMLMGVREALGARLTESWEVAEHFGIPDRMVPASVAPAFGVKGCGYGRCDDAWSNGALNGERNRPSITLGILAGFSDLRPKNGKPVSLRCAPGAAGECHLDRPAKLKASIGSARFISLARRQRGDLLGESHTWYRPSTWCGKVANGLDW